jgi:copper(I)-binding protein
MGGSSTTAGQMSMQPVDKIDVPAKGMVELKPGGFHIMLMGLKQPLVKGTSIDVTLTFASGASKTVKAEVRDA